MENKTCLSCGRSLTINRSNKQNSYYWKCIVEPLADELGMTKNEIHGVLKQKFLSPQYKTIQNKTGEVEEIELERSTTRLTTSQMESYHSEIRMWANEFLGMIIMLPNEPSEYV